MKIHHLCLLVLAIAQPVAQASSERPRDAVALGRYLVQTAGCNDYHSPGYSAHRAATRNAPLPGASGQFRRNSRPRFQGICLSTRAIAQRPKNVTMKVPTSSTR